MGPINNHEIKRKIRKISAFRSGIYGPRIPVPRPVEKPAVSPPVFGHHFSIVLFIRTKLYSLSSCCLTSMTINIMTLCLKGFHTERQANNWNIRHFSRMRPLARNISSGRVHRISRRIPVPSEQPEKSPPLAKRMASFITKYRPS